jgi:hypothetical protein
LTAFSTSTNRTNASYDAAGNMITDQASLTFTYDAETRQLTYNGGLGVVNYMLHSPASASGYSSIL